LEEALPFDADCIKAEKIALRLIARAEQNSSLLAAKLEKRGIDPFIARRVISGLLGKKLLDDERFAEHWIRAHLGGKRVPSPLWFLASLQKRGIDRQTSRNAINKVLDEETEYSLLQKFIERMGVLPKKTGLFRTKLRHEGFSPEAINRLFDSE
jgi:regulatory protein